MDITDEELIEQAKMAMKHSYSPYSQFPVGAALVTLEGNVYTGCNIENATFGATNCAERTAIYKAVSEGEKDFVKIAIVSEKGGFTYPCGICRQVMSEFFKEDALIILENNGEILRYTLKELLPFSFKL